MGHCVEDLGSEGSLTCEERTGIVQTVRPRHGSHEGHRGWMRVALHQRMIFAMKRLKPVLAGLCVLAGVSLSAFPARSAQNLLQMPVTITSCGQCSELTTDHGLNCFTCGVTQTCNCILGGFTWTDGKRYDGKWYPGVVI